MRIPDNLMSWTQVSRYGAGALELDPGTVEPGCPRFYNTVYVKKQQFPELSMPLAYGRAVHDALYRMEEEGLPPEEALRDAWAVELDDERFGEALQDIIDIIERGGVLTQIHTIAVEKELSMLLYEDEEFGPIRFRGIIDVLGVDATVDEPIPNLIFADYKTSRAPWSYADVQAWRQGKAYAMLVRENASEFVDAKRVNVVGLVEATKWYTIPHEYDDRDIDVFREWLISVARTILRDKSAKAKLNPHCDWCPIRGNCPAWRRLPGKGKSLAERMSAEPLEKRVESMIEAKEIRNRLDREIKDTQSAIDAHVRSQGPLSAAGRRWSLVPATTARIDPREAYGAIGAKLWPMVSVRITDMRRWVKRHPEHARLIRDVPSAPKLKDEEEET